MNLRAILKTGFCIVSLALYAGQAQAESGHTLHIYTENYPPYNMSLSGEPFAHNKEDMELGQIDLWITDGLTGPYVASEADVSGVTPVLTFRKTPLYLAINKDTDPSIISKIDSTFRFMLDSGEVESILHTYIK